MADAFAGRSVVIWGCGAIGAYIAILLARAGVRKLTLSDHDDITPGVLVRQPYTKADVLLLKDQVLAERLLAIRPDLEVIPRYANLLSGPLEEEPWHEDADILIDASGSAVVRMKLELVRHKAGDAQRPLAAMLLGHTAERGLAVLAPAGYSGGGEDQPSGPSPNINEMSRCVWTVGHSTHSSERLLELLRGQRIAYVVDVRSYPYSQIAPQHGREALAGWLAAEDIRYLYLGAELGGRPDSPEHYDEEGHALYRPMAERPDFNAALTRVLDGAQEHRIALLCSEGDPTHCHRRLLVGKVLADHGVRLCHIMRDGNVLTEDEVQMPSESRQCSLLEEPDPWRSTQSVSRRARLSTSSAA